MPSIFSNGSGALRLITEYFYDKKKDAVEQECRNIYQSVSAESDPKLSPEKAEQLCAVEGPLTMVGREEQYFACAEMIFDQHIYGLYRPALSITRSLKVYSKDKKMQAKALSQFQRVRDELSELGGVFGSQVRSCVLVSLSLLIIDRDFDHTQLGPSVLGTLPPFSPAPIPEKMLCE